MRATDTGRQGLTAESVLRCALLKQHRQLSYEELAFHLEDSASFCAFARLPVSCTPKKSGLHSTISVIRAETWEAINRSVIDSARQQKVEPGDAIRVDSTVTAALMHEPSDNCLLWDAVRVMARLLKAAQALAGDGQIVWRNHRRAAKRRAYQIAGIEAGISCLKRAYGLARCTWRGLDHFRAYVWSSVVAYNLTLLGRLQPS